MHRSKPLALLFVCFISCVFLCDHILLLHRDFIQCCVKTTRLLEFLWMGCWVFIHFTNLLLMICWNSTGGKFSLSEKLSSVYYYTTAEVQDRERVVSEIAHISTVYYLLLRAMMIYRLTFQKFRSIAAGHSLRKVCCGFTA